VGRSETFEATGIGHADHPHGRGEELDRPARRSYLRGSPPRAWGGAAWWLGGRAAARITPTGVGRSRSARARDPPHPDHPHGRGEERACLRCHTRCNGSPPRAWGGVSRSGDRWSGARITPTGVGRRHPPSRRRPDPADHPHGCGEERPRCRDASTEGGSPPRAWGGARAWRHGRRRRRITPTGVGRRTFAAVGGGATADHPHGRGEEHRRAPPGRKPNGSPPRAWGGAPPGATGP